LYLVKDLHFQGKEWFLREISFHVLPDRETEFKTALKERIEYLYKLSHPRLVRIVDYFFENQRAFIVQEKLSELFLSNYITQKEKLIDPQAIELGLGILEGIEYLHNLKDYPILLVNLNPNQILVTRSGIKLLDYGISSFFLKYGMIKEVLQDAPGYCAPEIVVGKQVIDYKADIYSVGVLLHYSLTGILPKSYPASFSSIRIKNPAVSAFLDKTIKRATNANPDERFSSAGEMRRALQKAIKSTKEVNGFSTKTASPKLSSYVKATTKVKSKLPRKIIDKVILVGVIIILAFFFYLLGGELIYKFKNLKTQATPELLPKPVNQPLFENKNEVTDYCLSGIQNYEEGNYAKAIEALNKAITINPANGLAMIYLENCYLDLNKTPSFKIGVAVPLEGASKAKGEAVLRGLAMAQYEINRKEILAGYGIKLVVRDDSSQIPKALEVAEEFTSRINPLIVIGHIDSAPTQATAPLYAKAKIVEISPTANCPEKEDLGNWMFRLSGTGIEEAQVIATYCRNKLNFKKMAIIYDPSQPYSAGLARSFIDKFVQLGGETEEFTAEMGKGDFSLPLSKILSLSDVALFLPMYHKDLLAVTNWLGTHFTNLQIVGPDAFFTRELLIEGGENVEGVVFTSLFTDSSDDPKVYEFVKLFKENFHFTPSAREALSYDTLMLITSALKVAGVDKKRLCNFLHSFNSPKNCFKGVTGDIYFDRFGNAHHSLYYVIKIKNGEFTLLDKFESFKCTSNHKK